MSKIIPYRYFRVSTAEQAKRGGGLDAQDEAVTKYINNSPDLFDLSNIVTMSDSGLSAYSGKNLSEGALGVFVKDVEEGRIKPGSALICYSIDRLSRQNPWIGSKLISTLIEAGIEIHSVNEKVVFKQDDPLGAIMSGIFLMRSNNESKIKSERAKDGYKARLKKSIENGTVLTRQMPRWLFSKDGMYAVDPDMKRVIDYSFESYIAGQSTGFIAQELNRRGWQYKGTEWRGTFVAKLIRDRRLIGEHIRYSKQIKGVKRVIEETIPDFYPEVVDRDTFNLANNMLTAVADNIRGRTRITYGDTSVLKNLFSGVIKCGCCYGDTTVVKNSRAGTMFIRCRNKYELKTCNQRDVKYETIEKTILNHLKGLDLSLLLTKPVDNKTELWKSELELCINDEIEYRKLIDERRANNKRIRPDTLQSLEDVQDRIDELRQKIDSHVEDDFVPDFRVDIESICDINNVRERSLVRKGINTIVERILYKRIDKFIIMEIKYSNKDVKHILVVDNKTTDMVVNYSIEEVNKDIVYTCNHFIVTYNKDTESIKCTDSSFTDYLLMMNHLDLIIDDPVSIKLKEYLTLHLDEKIINKKE